MPNCKDKIQRLQQLINKQEEKIEALTNKLKLYTEGVKHPSLIEKGNSTITPIPQFQTNSLDTILEDRERAIKKMNDRNKV